MDTVTLTVDLEQVTVEKGKTVLQAAIEAGISVPYYHPLDCPVCDKGGECPLQDFSYTFGPDQSRMEFPRRVIDGEGVRGDVDFGPTLMLNRQRCILCTRCVRFMRDVDGDAQINIIDRGYGSEIATFQEEGVHSLISGNLMDVCPVGAITTRDYRFKSRPWDNPNAVDTICTLCSKGCNTTAWIKAKPEWAKGSRLVRFTPRFNPDVNSYWMCDIGRFDYHWIEGDDRLRRPLQRSANGLQEPVSWHDLMSKLGDRIAAARPPVGPSFSSGVRFLLSAHASHEELFLFQRLAGPSSIAVSWRVTAKVQPPGTFKVPAVDAPNVNGARMMGLVGAGVTDEQREADVSALKTAVESGRISALYVFDPGPAGSIGDTRWIADARMSGMLPLLIVQGVLLTDLARAADFVLPGASYVEKEASYTNDQGRLQGVARAIPAPGEAMEDWQILVNLSAALGVPLEYTSPAHVRADIAARFAGNKGFEGIAKWDFMFQDLPPVKGTVDPSSLPTSPGMIPLKRIQ
jgi:NADH-quinone oxidoreductase subunit G